MNETPTICSMAYASNALSADSLGTFWAKTTVSPDTDNAALAFLRKLEQTSPLEHSPTDHFMANQNVNRRIVQVFIADPNDNVPLDHSVLYKGDQKLTDLTDSELFFEVPIAETLKKHNEKRITWLDKEASKRAGKDVFLDPAKIRDLKMVVVTVAAF